MTDPAVRRGNLQGALLLMAAALVFTVEVALVRHAGARVGTAQLVFFRAVSQLVLAGGLILLTAPALVRTGRPGLHLLRGLTSLVCWGLYYQSFLLLDLALATTLTFTTSLFVVALAGPLLGERVGRMRLGATVVGFAGVVLATGLGVAAPGLGVAIGIGSAIAGAALVFQNRILARTEATLTIMFYIGLATTLGTAPLALIDWHPMTGHDFALVSLAGALGALGMFLTIEAYRRGEVSALAPFPYLRLVFAICAGWLFFDEQPGWRVLLGAALVAGAAIAVARVEAQRRGLAAPHR